MRILWVVNTVLPIIADNCKINAGTGGGWLTGISSALVKNDIQLVICFPYIDNTVRGTANNIEYCSFPHSEFHHYDKRMEDYLYKTFINENPDVIHIFGTEFPHSLAAVNAAERCDMLDKTVISIQGMVSVYAKHYYAGLTPSVIHRCTLRDFVKLDNIYRQRRKYVSRGRFEISAIKKVRHVIGRTDWDEACVKSINPNIDYHFCNETLRDEFYTGKWEYEKCEKHSIFLGNSYYPIKGLHCVLDILPQIISRFPDTKLYVPGQDPLKLRGINGIIHKSYYQVYLAKTIKKYSLNDKIVFLGNLSAEEMKNRMLKSNVYVLPSSIENSPNTLCEAMLLGVPCIAADVGGVKNLAADKSEALIYPFDENYILPLYVSKIFENQDLARKMSEAARKHALQTHDKENNSRILIDIYSDLCRQ